MYELTKQKATELDDLLIALLQAKPDNFTGWVDINIVAKSIESIKDKDRNYVQGLLYIARQLPETTPRLFTGLDNLTVHHDSLRQFLYAGGFKKMYAKSKIKPWHKKDWYKEQIFKWVITTILGLVAGYITGVSVGKAKNQRQKQEQKVIPELNQKRN